MCEKPDFDALRAKRNGAVQNMIDGIAKDYGWDTSKVQSTFDPNACYCACPNGPCEHDFQGSEPIYNDNDEECGAQAVCTRCGLGAMYHDIRTCEF